MRLGIKAPFFVAILLFAASCTYDFSEDYFEDIKVVEPYVNISFMGFTAGENISSSRMVRYTVSGVGNDEFEMVFRVDGVEIHRTYERRGEFYLYVDELVDGAHKLSVEYIFPTYSGSLAATVGGEYYLGAAEYGFIIDKSLAESFGIKSVDIVEGSVYISLNPVTDDNFEEAYLLIQNEHGYVIEERPISQQDLADLVIHDEQTVDYNPGYAIKVKNAFVEDASEFVVLPTPKMEFTVEPLGYRKFKLIYTGHPLYENFDRIGFDYTYPYSGSKFHELNPQGGEKIMDYGYFFGEAFHVYFNIFRDEAVIGNIYGQLQVGGSLPVSAFEEITYIPSIDKYFILDVDPSYELVIHELNGQSFEVENSERIAALDFGGDFRSLEVEPVSGNLVINMKAKSLVFDPATSSIVGIYEAADYNSGKPNADVYYRGDYVILEESWSSGEVLIYEIATGELKFSVNKTTGFFSAVDASFFYANKGLYKLQDGEFVFLNTIRHSQQNMDAPALEYMTFDKASNSAVFGWYRQTYYLDLTNNEQHYLWDPEVVYDVKYTEDGRPLINSSHFSAGYRSHLYDADSKEMRTIETFGQQSYRYFNGVIFSPIGYYLESDLYTDL